MVFHAVTQLIKHCQGVKAEWSSDLQVEPAGSMQTDGQLPEKKKKKKKKHHDNPEEGAAHSGP